MPASYSAQFGLIGLSDILLKAGADPEGLDANGQSPIQAMEAFSARIEFGATEGSALNPHGAIKAMIQAASEAIELNLACEPARAPSRKNPRI